MIRHLVAVGIAVLVTGCVSAPSTKTAETCPEPEPCPVCPVCPVPPAPPPPKVSVLEAVSFGDIAGWRDDELAGALGAMRASCQALRFRPAWREACSGIDQLSPGDSTAFRRFLESRFKPYRLASPDGSTQGLITGYYEPLLRGSRERSGPYRFPLYAPPDDLLVIDLAGVNPDLKNLRLRGRLEGRRVVPYYSRAEIERGDAPVAGKEIVWVDDAIEAFFLEIQGSGRIRLDSGETLRLGFADQNGHPYRSIGRWLVDQGQVQANEASMDGIKAWARAHPASLDNLLNQNPSYVFFREFSIPEGAKDSGPPGALGVPLTPGRSIAVDPRYVPLGAPVFLATTWPNTQTPLARLVMAQDTGGAIRGPVRADFFWGFGDEAAREAGRMKQSLRMWVLLPNAYRVPVSQQ